MKKLINLMAIFLLVVTVGCFQPSGGGGESKSKDQPKVHNPQPTPNPEPPPVDDTPPPNPDPTPTPGVLRLVDVEVFDYGEDCYDIGLAARGCPNATVLQDNGHYQFEISNMSSTPLVTKSPQIGVWLHLNHSKSALDRPVQLKVWYARDGHEFEVSYYALGDFQLGPRQGYGVMIDTTWSPECIDRVYDVEITAADGATAIFTMYIDVIGYCNVD